MKRLYAPYRSYRTRLTYRGGRTAQKVALFCHVTRLAWQLTRKLPWRSLDRDQQHDLRAIRPLADAIAARIRSLDP